MEFLREKDAAKRLCVKPRTLQRWRSEGTGPRFIRMGVRLIAYSQADLDAWAAAQSHTSLAAELAQRVAA